MDDSTQRGMPRARISYGASRDTHRDLREAQACGPRSQVSVPLAHPEPASLPEQVLFVSWVWSSSSRALPSRVAAKSVTSLEISRTEVIAAAQVTLLVAGEAHLSKPGRFGLAKRAFRDLPGWGVMMGQGPLSPSKASITNRAHLHSNAQSLEGAFRNCLTLLSDPFQKYAKSLLVPSAMRSR